jgi:hypothetical protein
MADNRKSVKGLRGSNPLFFWGMVTVALLLLTATAVVAMRIPEYRAQAASIDRAMSETERETRDRILNSQARRSELAVALLQREIRIKAMEQKGIHLAVSIEDSTLSLRHGDAILREARLTIGSDSIVRAPDGRDWRLVLALGERHLKAKETNPTAAMPEWAYAAHGLPIPSESERAVAGGLGRYVLRMDDGTEIHTRPSSGPFSEGVRPAGFIVESERDMRAIFDALAIDTPVYIY